jgi:hypothetical protein
MLVFLFRSCYLGVLIVVEVEWCRESSFWLFFGTLRSRSRRICAASRGRVSSWLFRALSLTTFTYNSVKSYAHPVTCTPKLVGLLSLMVCYPWYQASIDFIIETTDTSRTRDIFLLIWLLIHPLPTLASVQALENQDAKNQRIQ